MNEAAGAPSLASEIRGGLTPGDLNRADASPDAGDPAAVGGNPEVGNPEALSPDGEVRFGANPLAAAKPADADPGGAMAADPILETGIPVGGNRIVGIPTGGVFGGGNRFGARNSPDDISRIVTRAGVLNPSAALKDVGKTKAGRRKTAKRLAGVSPRQDGNPPAF